MCVHMHMYVHTCVYVWCIYIICMWTYANIYVYIEVREQYWVLYFLFLHLIFWDRASDWSWDSLTGWPGWPVHSRIHPSLLPKHWGCRHVHHHARFLYECGASHSDPQACAVDGLSKESSQAQVFLLIDHITWTYKLYFLSSFIGWRTLRFIYFMPWLL